jgi:ABC-2 type transport system ATP-binding protein
MANDVIIDLKGVSKSFRDFWLRPTVQAVSDLSMSVKRGEVFGLLGPNGSGKSTTIKMILGLLRPSSGEVSLFGFSPQAKESRRRIGYLPENSYLHPYLTARETFEYYAGLASLSRKESRLRSDQLLEMMGMTSYAERAVGSFSKGMARRVALGSALISKPELLILDEPTSGLDPVSTKEVKDLIASLSAGGMTVLTTSHMLSDSEDICSRVMILNQGRKVAEGLVSELGTSLETFFLKNVGEGKSLEIAEFLK